MKNIKNYHEHLRESDAAPQTRRSIDDLWLVYYKEDDKYHFIAAYEERSAAESRLMEEATDWHGGSIDDVVQQEIDNDPEEFGNVQTASELRLRDPRAYKVLWLFALELIEVHQEGEGREYFCEPMENVERRVSFPGGEGSLRRFMKDLTSSDETPGWAKSAIERRERSRGAFGRF